jgi:transcription factor E
MRPWYFLVMQSKLLKSVVGELAGVASEEIIDILFNKRDVNEFLIAKKMKLTINQVRNILYKLSAEGLVSFTRKKDKRKGWYIYFWTLNTEKCLIRLEQELMKRITELETLLYNRQTKRFYVCKSCNIEVGEELALEHDFACQECADVYELADNERPIREITAKIKAKQRDLEVIRTELVEVRAKLEKKSKSSKPVKKSKEKKIAKKKTIIKKKIAKKIAKKITKKKK